MTDRQDCAGLIITGPSHVTQMSLPLWQGSVSDMDTKYTFYLKCKKRGFILEPNMNDSSLGTWIQFNSNIIS